MIKGNARLSILKIAMAISVSLKPALAFTLCILTSHDEKLMNPKGLDGVNRAGYNSTILVLRLFLVGSLTLDYPGESHESQGHQACNNKCNGYALHPFWDVQKIQLFPDS